MGRSRSKKLDKKSRKRAQQQRQLERCPPRLGHESMLAIPAFRHAATALIARVRGTGPAPNRLVREEDLAVPEVDEALHGRYAIARQVYGWSHEQAVVEAEQVCSHLFCAVNHELGGKKTFWVSAELAEALQHTSLDISGEVLRTPFPCCAFVFNDAATLRLVQALVEKRTTAGRDPFRTLTVYVYASGEAAERGYDFVFLADGYDGEWPYLISRCVPTDGKRNLDEILNSHPDDSTDAFFRTDEMQGLLHLAINAVLYTICEGYRCEVRGPAPPALHRCGRTQRLYLSSDGVFFLPGRIVVGERTSEAHPSSELHSYVIQKRFWVRGHWRRPNANWQDQRLRWIAPYLKGPELAAIIEREYELRGSSTGGGELGTADGSS